MSREQLRQVMPAQPGDDRGTLYLGIRTVHGSTRVLFCRVDGTEGFLPHPGVGTPSIDGTFEWGARATADAATVSCGYLLATALLLDAVGHGTPEENALLRGAMTVEVIPLLDDEEWELTDEQIRAWVKGRVPPPAPPAATYCPHELEDLGGGRWRCAKCRREGTWVDGMIHWDGAADLSEGGGA